jgi:hypothetical protein
MLRRLTLRVPRRGKGVTALLGALSPCVSERGQPRAQALLNRQAHISSAPRPPNHRPETDTLMRTIERM